MNCEIENVSLGDALWVEGCRAEVVGLRPGQAQALLFDDARGLRNGLSVEASGPLKIRVHPSLRGRLLDHLGSPLDGLELSSESQDWLIHRGPVGWSERQKLTRVWVTGTRSIDALLTLAQGQLVAWLGAQGTGSKFALAKVAREGNADLVVWACIGSHYPELRNFFEQDLGPQGRERCLCIVAGAEQSAAARVQAAFTALAAAEYFREQGLHVVLVIDSVKAWRSAYRELLQQRGLWHPVPPADLGSLPLLLARCGATRRGSITALLHHNVEEIDWREDELAFALSECAEGHLVFSQRQARCSVYPAVDPLLSRSRASAQVAERTHLRYASKVWRWLSDFEDHREAFESGLIQLGSDPSTDRSISRYELVQKFLRQNTFESSTWEQTQLALEKLAQGEMA